MKIKKILAVATLMAVSVVGVGCNNQQPTKQEPVKEAQEVKGTLTFGAMGAVDAIPFVMAKENGYFEKAGVDVELEIFKNSKDRDAALQAGALDGIIGDEVAIVLFQNSGFDMKITGVTDGEFTLVTAPNSDITTIEDLKGKKVAISEKTVIEFTLDKLLEEKGLTPEDVVKEVIPPLPTRLEMLRNNQVDAALLPDPFASTIAAEKGNVLGKMTPDSMYISIMAFNQKAIEEKPELIKAFKEGYNEAVDYLNTTDIKEYEQTVIDVVGYPETMKGNIILPKYRKDTLPSQEDLQQVIDWSKAKGLLTTDLTPEQMVSDIAIK